MNANPESSVLLIVENDAGFAAKLKKHLRLEGLRNFLVETVEDARFLLNSLRAELILLNLNAVTDWDALLAIRRDAQERGLPILYIEGFKKTGQMAERLREQDVKSVLSLPFGLSDLVKALQALRKDRDPMIGLRLGPKGQEVEITNLLGSGAMGTVYEAHQESLDRHVAVKFLGETYQKHDPDSAKRFYNEAKAIAQMRSPHVVHVFFVGTHDDRPYMVMELIEGPNLDKYLRAKKVLCPREALDLCRQILMGLAHAHQQGKVHRDMKPANIMLTKEGQAVILDFGLVRGSGAQNLTKVGMVLGTPRYISPEQVVGKPTDHRCDLYSVGIILFEMLVGEAPFQGEDFLAILMKHAKEPLPKPDKFGKTLDARLFEIIEKLTQKQPEARYPSAREAVQAIDALVAATSNASLNQSAGGATTVTRGIRPIGGLAINDSGTPISRFGKIAPERAQSLRIVQSILTQIQDIDDLGVFERGILGVDSNKLVIFSCFNGLAAIESELDEITSQFNRLSREELEQYFEKERFS